MPNHHTTTVTPHDVDPFTLVELDRRARSTARTAAVLDRSAEALAAIDEVLS